MQQADKRPCVVLGMSVNGLSVARNLGRRGISVIGIDSGRGQPGLYSRYCRPLICPDPLNQKSAFLDFLIRLSKDLAMRPVLLITADDMLQTVSANRELLAAYYDFTLPGNDLFKIFLDKTRTIELLDRHHIARPATWVVNNMDDLKTLAGKLSYPCILKPAHSHLWKQHFRGKKLSIVQSFLQLEENYAQAAAHHLSAMVQEIIPGDDSHLCTFLGYYDAGSNPLCVITKRKLRQYPPHFGDGSFQESRHIQEIITISDRFLRDIGYTGLASIEYKLDPRDGRYKFIENNMRTVSGNELLARSGADLVYVYYRDMTGRPVQQAGPYREGIKLCNFPWDCASFYQSWQMGELTLRAWIDSYRGKLCHASFDFKDLKPFFANYTMIVRKLMRRVRTFRTL